MAHLVVDTISIHHRVTVVCVRPSYDPTERRPWRPYQTETAELGSVIRGLMADAPRLPSMEAAERVAAPAYDRVAEFQKYRDLFDDIRAR